MTGSFAGTGVNDEDFQIMIWAVFFDADDAIDRKPKYVTENS